MELPQARTFGAEGRKPTHDFLSLYSHSTTQQDPRPTSQGSYLKTHDFLQPLEGAERKTNAKVEEAGDHEISSVAQKQPPAAPCVEHILPGGIGTYSISHISYFSNHRIPKPEASSPFTVPSHHEPSKDRNEDSSNCTSYTSSGFNLWEESAVKKGKTGKENDAAEKSTVPESAAKSGHWTLTERPTQLFANNNYNSFNSITSSQKTGQKNQSFMEMIKSAKDCAQDEELDNDEALIFKKESSITQRGDLRVKVDGKSTDQRPNTPRSKHSATEQRRRSKINDRQMLRELIPHSDQKRDKASFLLEVIEYIQFLQEKVHKYEGSYQMWNQEKEKLTPWRNNHRPSESYDDQSHGTNSGSGPSPKLLFASKIGEKNFSISPTVTGSIQNEEAGMSTATTLKAMDQHPGITNKAMYIPNSSQPNFYSPGQSGGPGGVVSQLTHRLASDAENTTCKPSMHSQNYSCATEVTPVSDKLKEKDLTIEGGAISISSVYSKGLLDTLTQALKSSGVDLSQASISVQIELAKQANIKPIVPTSGAKDEVPSSNQVMKRSRGASIEGSDQSVKKLKAFRS
ncbi:transcription factor BIM1 isoform X1 [Senna tora]|uniref:Transcription factor BIM1 isoform X1 n=1 Tax=Senna tora TaxID=362788 RepID=A0A834SRT2_9FABA|nr:transcription factor BIM1 isoform X1 [Senna tora]